MSKNTRGGVVGLEKNARVLPEPRQAEVSRRRRGIDRLYGRRRESMTNEMGEARCLLGRDPITAETRVYCTRSNTKGRLVTSQISSTPGKGLSSSPVFESAAEADTVRRPVMVFPLISPLKSTEVRSAFVP